MGVSKPSSVIYLGSSHHVALGLPRLRCGIKIVKDPTDHLIQLSTKYSGIWVRLLLFVVHFNIHGKPLLVPGFFRIFLFISEYFIYIILFNSQASEVGFFKPPFNRCRN